MPKREVLAELPICRDTVRDFYWHEVCCQRTGLIRPTKAMFAHMQRVQLCRDWWNASISCTGVRTPYHNMLEGSTATNSHHILWTNELTLDDIQADDFEMQRFATDLRFSLKSSRIGSTPNLNVIERRTRANRLAYDWLDELVGESCGLALYEWGVHFDCRTLKWRRDNTR